MDAAVVDQEGRGREPGRISWRRAIVMGMYVHEADGVFCYTFFKGVGVK
jgi:hypothetical protein